MALTFSSSMNGFGTYREVSNLVIDVSWVAQRHAHALGSRFKTSEGVMSGHLFGAFKDITSLVYQLNPSHLVFTYDRGYAWRKKILPGYKASRNPADGVKDHVNPSVDLERLFRFLPATHLSLDGFEADDMMGWFCDHIPGDIPTSIYTKDKDIWQLVDDKSDICCMMPVKEKPRSRSTLVWIDESAVKDSFGVPPSLVPRHKALLGDKSDGIQGLKGGRKPGKKDALRDFLLSESSEDYFNPQNTVPNISDAADFLQKPLMDERRLMLDNLKVADIGYAVSKIKSTNVSPMETTEASLMGVMDILVEFECESLLARAEPFMSHLSDIISQR